MDASDVDDRTLGGWGVGDHRPDLDALAGRRLGIGEGILERSMRGIARRAVGVVVEALEQDHLVVLHVRKIEPILSRAVPDLEYLTFAVLID